MTTDSVLQVEVPGRAIAHNVPDHPLKVKDERTRESQEKAYEDAVAVARKRERQAIAKAGLNRLD